MQKKKKHRKGAKTFSQHFIYIYLLPKINIFNMFLRSEVHYKCTFNTIKQIVWRFWMSVSGELSNANLKQCSSLLTLHPWTEPQPLIWCCQVLIEIDDWHESKTSSRHQPAEFSQATWKAVELFKQGLGSPSRVRRFQAITLKVYISVSRRPQPWHFRHLSCHRWVWSTLSAAGSNQGC